MEIFCKGKANIAYVTQDMLKQCNATMDEADGAIEKLRTLGYRNRYISKRRDKPSESWIAC